MMMTVPLLVQLLLLLRLLLVKILLLLLMELALLPVMLSAPSRMTWPAPHTATHLMGGRSVRLASTRVPPALPHLLCVDGNHTPTSGRPTHLQVMCGAPWSPAT